MRSRRPAVAGRFYPRDPVELRDVVDTLVAAAKPPPGAPYPKAVIVPHAGYAYSGPIAASAYARLAGAPYARALLLGPSHFVPLDGMAASAAATWTTPLGPVAVERPDTLPADDGPHQREHALEVQLPFLQRVLPSLAAVAPVAVGYATPESVAEVIAAAWTDPSTLVVVSTDLSHYHDADTARRLDRRTADAVLAGDVEAITAADACGYFALRGAVEFARRRGLTLELLDLRMSADTAGDPHRVVGYAAFALAASHVSPGM